MILFIKTITIILLLEMEKLLFYFVMLKKKHPCTIRIQYVITTYVHKYITYIMNSNELLIFCNFGNKKYEEL